MKLSHCLAAAVTLGLLAVAGLALAHGPDHADDNPVLAEGPHQVSAHPDLLERIGRKGVAKLQARAETPAMMEDLNRGRPDKSAAGAAVTGTGSCLVILMDFSDHTADQASHPSSAYGNMMFSTGTFPTGSMNDYYLEVSHGLFGVSGTIAGWHRDANTYASYQNPDGSQDAGTARIMLTNAIAALDATIDFSQFDNDGPDGVPNSGDDDGNVDAVFFVHAGPGEEQSGNPNDIWSHAWGFWPALATADGVNIFRYSVEPEEFTDGSMITVGVFAHEYGHVLGLPDLYDTDYSSRGIGQWGLMSGGSWTRRNGGAAGSSPTHFTAWSKMQLGWITPFDITADSPGLTAQPAETNPVAYRICPYGNPAATEYFLVENRRRLGFDEGLTRRQQYFGLPDPEGLIIYHVDDNQSNNADDAHRLVDVVDASPWFTSPTVWHENLDAAINNWALLSDYNSGDNGDLWPGFSTANAGATDWLPPRDRTSFSDATIPGAGTYECAPSLISIDNIQMAGVDVTFDVTVGLDAELGPLSTNPVWDFEVDDDGWQYCNSKVHHDFTQSQSCTGTGGLWFGQTGWANCGGNGYGNNWNDYTWVTVGVDVNAAPSVDITHHYSLENGYDWAYIEVRPGGRPDIAWVTMGSFTGVGVCATQNYVIPAGVLAMADPDGNGFGPLDIRLRLQSDTSYSPEDGNYCGLGWWVDFFAVHPAYPAGTEIPTLGAVTRLEAPSPNPFNPTTTLKYHLPAGARDVSLTVFDQRGRQVRELDVERTEGWHEVMWDGRDAAGGRVASGLYFARLRTDDSTEIQKMALVK
ncbi:MAG: M6 family metalloprotease domain-containing protein [bacterium]|nr:M6 family metalloprotease domain-containing protein [bacterium]